MFSENIDSVQPYDDIVIGAGSSGIVLASRLSEDPGRRVLLLEAGSDYVTEEAMPEMLKNANQPASAPGLNWKISALIKEELARYSPREVLATAGDRDTGGWRATPAARPTSRSTGSTFDYEAGKVVGGSSAINAVQALRGTPADYNEWAALCGGEWSWDQVLPFFRLLEDDPLGSENLHGRGGPIPIRREVEKDLKPLQQKLMEACRAQGYPETADHNDHETTGVGIIPKNVLNGVRISTALSYLAPARLRPNLTILSRAHVHHLLWKSSKVCDGVAAEIGGKVIAFKARRVILCAGALNTPAILLRSGIGSPSRLQAMDIVPRIPLHGVGENLMDHPVVCLWAVPREGMSAQGDPMRQTLLRYTSDGSDQRNDMHICLMAGIDIGRMWSKLSTVLDSDNVVGLSACLMKSRSRGHVRLRSADPHAPPQVVVGCLADQRDLPPLKEGVRRAWQLIQDKNFRPYLQRILAWTDGMIRSDMALEQAISTFVRPSAHAAGSAKMGLSPEDGAVVDPTGRIYGADNIWVADASIMPTIPSAPTNLTSIMIAEKIASQLKYRDG